MNDPVNPSSRPVKDSSPLANPKSRSLKDSSALANPNARPLNDLRSFASGELKMHAEAQAASRREGNHAKEPVGIQRTTTEMPALRGFTDPPQKARRQKNLPPPDGGKPFAFALGKADDGATIWWGMLAAKLQILNFTREDGFLTSVTQPPILKTDFYPVSGIDADTTKPTHLGFWGDVYVYWEADDSGTISIVEIRGPEAPDGEDIGELEPDLTREITSGKYFVKIGTVPENGDIDQQISSDIPWFVTIAKGTDTSGSDSTPSEESNPSSAVSSAVSSGIGSSKDTAVVLGPNGTKVKWYAMESSEVLFFDFQEFQVGHGTTRVEIDPVVLFGIEKETARAWGSPDVGNVNVTVEGDHIVVRPRFSKRHRQQAVQVMLKGVRRGFKDIRNAHASYDDLVDNECRLNPRMTRKQIVEQLAKEGVVE